MYNFSDLDAFVEQELRNYLEQYFTVSDMYRKDGTDRFYFGLYPHKNDRSYDDIDKSKQSVFMGMVMYYSNNDSIYLNYESYHEKGKSVRCLKGPYFDRKFTSQATIVSEIEHFCNSIVCDPFVSIVDKR